MDSASLSSLSPFKEPRIDSEESILLAYVARRAVTTNRVFVPALQARNRFLGSFKGLQIRALAGRNTSNIQRVVVPALATVGWRNRFLGVDTWALKC
jgi:hypothetical protein